MRNHTFALESANCSGTDISYTGPDCAQVGGCIIKGKPAEAPNIDTGPERLIQDNPVGPRASPISQSEASRKSQ